jgi:hypothetical protein
MSKLQWGILAAIALIVLATQLPHHDHGGMPGHETHGVVATDGPSSPGLASVTLAVSGMT